MNPSSIRCVLFDNDGTLVDSEALCTLALQQQFADYGVVLDYQYLFEHYRGGQLSQIFTQLCQQHQLPLPADYETQYRARLASLFAAQLQPVTGAAELLQQCAAQGWHLAVVSNGPRSKIESTLQQCGLAQFFQQRYFSAYECGFFKPDGRLYLHAAQAMGFSPAECIVIEDSPPGVQAGLQAGMLTFFVNHHQSPVPDGAVAVAHLAELATLITAQPNTTNAAALGASPQLAPV